MKKKLLALALAGLLMAPSVVLAEATWYGSFRAGIKTAPYDGTGDNAGNEVGKRSALHAPGSRWGVRGSNEISDGLSAVYRYEEALDLRNATLSAGNRLSFVGLSGGFGTLTMGRVWGAEYNSTGVITDNSYFHGNSYGSYRVGPAVSYAISTGPVSLQLDAVMSNNPKSVDRMLFGASAGFGAGKVAVSYDSNSDNATQAKTTNTTFAGEVSFGSLRAYAGQATMKPPSNDKNRTIMGGVGGSLGDTGMGFLMQVSKERDNMGKPTPVLLSLYRSLGGGSTVILESLFNDKNENGTKRSTVASLTLKVDF